MEFQAIDIVRQVEQEADLLIEQAKNQAKEMKDQAVQLAQEESDKLLADAKIKAKQLDDVAVKIGQEEVRPILQASEKLSDQLLAMPEETLSAVAKTIVERILG